MNENKPSASDCEERSCREEVMGGLMSLLAQAEAAEQSAEADDAGEDD